MNVLFLLGLHLIVAGLAGASANAAKFIMPFQVIDGTSTAEVLTVDGGTDIPKLTPGVNASTFEWWYFDAVSTTTNESFTITFYNFGETTLEVPYLGGPLVVQISGTFNNGTSFLKSVAATRNASLLTTGSDLFSRWSTDGGNYSFTGSDVDNIYHAYEVSIHDPDTGISGWLNLQSSAFAHLPCHFNHPGHAEEIIPDIYWLNAVPDADATVELSMGGESLHFKGLGYHDKKWGVKPLKETLDTWYWGHARLGPYSLVWFDALARDGKEYFSSWIAQNDLAKYAGCEDRSVVVRPWGENSTYPPTPKLPAPSGYDIRYDAGHFPPFVARFYTSTIQLSTDTYKRLTGPIVGGPEGQSQFSLGTAMCEQVHY